MDYKRMKKYLGVLLVSFVIVPQFSYLKAELIKRTNKDDELQQVFNTLQKALNDAKTSDHAALLKAKVN